MHKKYWIMHQNKGEDTISLVKCTYINNLKANQIMQHMYIIMWQKRATLQVTIEQRWNRVVMQTIRIQMDQKYWLMHQNKGEVTISLVKCTYINNVESQPNNATNVHSNVTKTDNTSSNNWTELE